jgi:putative spermidine/putrescine transport system ATP-binding protein
MQRTAQFQTPVSLQLAERPERHGKDVVLEGIRKTYGPTVALPDLSLDIPRGQFCTLLGASGSGKTTLLKIIAGFEAPTTGSVHIGGEDVTHTPIAQRNIGMVFQNYALFPHMTVFDNVAFALRMRRVKRDEIKRRVDEVLELVSMDKLHSRLPRELSGGQQQRAALARALVFTPDILLMDEPLGALDKNLRQAIQLQLKKLHYDLGLTIVFVTHDQEEAMNLSERIVIMDHGRIVQAGAPEALYRAPESPFVAGFLGECNFVDRAGHVLGVRPENVRIGTQLTSSDLRHEGRIVASTFCALHWKIFIEAPGRTVVAYAPAGTGEAERTPGQSIVWGFSAEDAMEFAAA